MTDETRSVTAARLRDAFDRSFAARSATDRGAHDDLLAVRIGGDPYALRVSELAALHADRVIVRLPSPAVDLLGLVTLRGVMVPVYDLGALLGYTAASTARWLAIVRSSRPLGVAFDLFEQHVRVPSELEVVDRAADREGLVRGVVHTAEVARPIVHMASVLEAIEKRAARPNKE